MLLSRIFLQAFTLTFLAEWGDRSQLTTIILAAREVKNDYSYMYIRVTHIFGTSCVYQFCNLSYEESPEKFLTFRMFMEL